MKQTWKGAVVATAGVLAISGGIVAGAVLPAAASPAFNEAYATQAFGLINSAPTAVAQYPGQLAGDLAVLGHPGTAPHRPHR